VRRLILEWRSLRVGRNESFADAAPSIKIDHFQENQALGLVTRDGAISDLKWHELC
jgi:hypothetical protein